MTIQDSDRMDGLLSRYCEGEATKEEVEQIERWMMQSDENRQTAKQSYATHLLIDNIDVSKCIDVDSALRKVSLKIEKTEKNKKKIVWMNWLQRSAAILIIPLLIAYCFSLYHSRPASVQMLEVKTNPGMTASVILPDSSVVILNSESSLTYPSSFSDKERRVILKGEAYFSVTKNKNKKFIVNTAGNAQIRVYGTEFDVEAYPDMGIVNATLVSGKVSFVYPGQSEVVMKPGQKAVYDIQKKKVILKTTFVEGDISWKDGYLIFRDTPFDDVLKSLSKCYNVDFVIKRNKLHEYSFTGVFKHQRLSRILEYFKISSNIKFKYVNESNGDLNNEREKIEIY